MFLTLDVSQLDVRFVIAKGKGTANGITNYNHPHGIRIYLDAELVWPLLIPEYTDSEKASHWFFLAVVILHELIVRLFPNSMHKDFMESITTVIDTVLHSLIS